MELMNSLSDDQKALIGCFGALMASGLILSMSSLFQRRSQPQRILSEQDRQVAVSLRTGDAVKGRNRRDAA